MDENGVLPDFKGIAVHDCWKAYWRYLEATHAICGVHILRELVGVIENPPPLQTEIKRGRKKKGKVLALIERLAQLKDSMLLFARNFEVPFTNYLTVFLLYLFLLLLRDSSLILLFS